MTVLDIYNERCQQASDIQDHLPFLHRTVVDRNAQVVVELGVRSGMSTAAFLAGVEQTGGHLWSVDIVFPKVPHEMLVHDQWTLLVGDDLTMAESLPERIDVLFIDTSHAYQQTVDELEMYAERADVVLLHDTQLEAPDQVGIQPPYPVRKAALEWHQAHPTWGWREFTNCYGLGVLTRGEQ
jgi:predicted O-methyltransferase YrrM